MSNSHYIKHVLLHASLGFAFFLAKPLSKVYFVAIFVYFLWRIIQSKPTNKAYWVIGACSYVVTSEVFLRMTGGNFLYEASKYMVIFYLLLGILYDGIHKKAWPYFLYLIALLPGIVVAGNNLSFMTNIRKAIAFNLSGPVCLGIAALYCYNRFVTYEQQKKLLQMALLPIIAMTVYLFFYTPDIRDVLTGTQSNFAASGGFGPNQVATILGLGMFISSVNFVVNSPTIVLKIVHLVLLALMSYRGFVTFSRGGILVAAIMIVAFLYLYFQYAKPALKTRLISSLVIVFVVAGFTYASTIVLTDGLIVNRYTNKDARGRVKEDVTTGRGNLLSYEFDEFIKNPFIGIGVGRSKDLRLEREGVVAASHNEMSRILAEHGILGILGLLILLVYPIVFRLENNRNLLFYSMYFFWFFTINHSSMRIAAPAFIYGLCLLNINYNES